VLVRCRTCISFLAMCFFLQQKKCVCVCVCVWRGGGYYLWQVVFINVFQATCMKVCRAQNFHSGVGNDILVNHLHHIITKIQHFDVLRTSYALISSEQRRFSVQWFVGFILHTFTLNTFAASYLNTQGLNNSCLKSPASTLVDHVAFQSRALRSFSLNQLRNLSL